MLDSSRVALYKSGGTDCGEMPYNPAQSFPETPFRFGSASNQAYEAVRGSLALLGLDKSNLGTANWNPLGDLVRPGDHVLLKPNFLAPGHPARPEEWEQVITHPAILRPILDYVYIALRGSGRVTIADGPQYDSDFDEIRRRTQTDELAELYRSAGLEVAVIDLRDERWNVNAGIIERRSRLPGDPAGYATVTLERESAFWDYSLSGRFYGADYNIAETARYHSYQRHTYVVSKSVLDADVLINVPKLKTHKKTGVTLSLKNLVGAAGRRNCLPHHTLGVPAAGGDEFDTNGPRNRLQSAGISHLKKCMAHRGGKGGPMARMLCASGRLLFGDTSSVVRSGNWFGNDTIWRTVIDVNKCVLLFDGHGQRRSTPRRCLNIVDGFIAGDGDGPHEVDRRACGLIACGANPLAVDTACAAVMGFDTTRIPMLARAWCDVASSIADRPVSSYECSSNLLEWNGPLPQLFTAPHLGFRAHFGWAEHIERRR
jgi:uncharacterized protein (DUF362 family)